MGTLLIKVALVLVLFIQLQRSVCGSSEGEEISSSSTVFPSSSTVFPSTNSSTTVDDRSEDESTSPTSGLHSTATAKSSSTSKPSSSTSDRHSTAKSTSKPSTSTSSHHSTSAKSSTSKPSTSTSGHHSTSAKSSSTSKPSTSTSGHHSTSAKSSSTSKPSTSTSSHHSTSAKSSTSKPSTSTSGHHTTSAKSSSTSKPSTSTSSHHSTTAKSTSKPSTSTSGRHSTTANNSPSVQTSTKHSTTHSATSKSSPSTASSSKLSTPTSVSSKSTSQKHTTTAKPSTASSSKHVSTSKMSTGHSSTLSTSHVSQSTSRRPSSTTVEQPSSVSTSQQISSSTTRSPSRRRRAVESKPALPSDPLIGGSSGNPGTILKLNKKLLVNHVKEACRKAEKEKCEDRSASDDIVFDLPSGRVAIRDLFLTSLSLPLVMVDVSPPNLLVWSTDKARLSATGSWIYSPSDASSVNHTGKLYLPSSSFVADLNTSMGRSEENQPAISKVDCSIKISCKSNVIYSSPSIPARLAIAEIESNITAMIKNELESVMCYFSSFVLQSALNNILSTFHTRVELWDFPKISLDNSLIADPYVDPEDFSVNVPLNGSILVDDHSVDFYPHDMASVGNYSKMITTLFGDYVMNSFLASAYEAGMFNKIEVASSYSSKIAELLALSCSADALCVGSALPYNSSSSDDFAELSIAVNSTPSAVFLESGGFLQANGSLAVRINNSTGKFVHYSSPFSLVASLKPSIREDKLYSMLSMEADVIDFQLNDVSKLILIFSPQDKVNQLMRSIFQEVINKPLRQGIPVPMFFNNKIIRLGDHEFAFRNRTLILGQNPVD